MLGLDLTLSYNGSPVVHGATLALEPGRITALVGPNGSGKSTLLRAFARLHPIDAGGLFLGPRDPESAQAVTAESGADASAIGKREFARRVTLLAQSRPTPTGLSVREVVEFGRHPHRGRWARADEKGTAIVDRAMTLTGIDTLADRPVDRLSGGQLQRVWLAGCLAQDTDVLLLDEPTTYLDLRYQVELLDLIQDLAAVHGVTIGVVLHDLDQAAAIADTVVLLEAGRVRAAGTPLEVFDTELLSSVYGIRVDVHVDARTGRIRTNARSRHEPAPLPAVSPTTLRAPIPA
ncbi:ABC transporter ATP-binding protein [Mycetocola sp. 2940]|uniref:ABC transporter ATP-binding protein n=1 Tax=Mycetocola sp. 2940 TaxID=3156452 RepID=UPI00339AF436